VLPRAVQRSLLATQAVAFATLARSVAYERWFTVALASLMIIGAFAAMRHRTWGVLLSFATAATFAALSFVGIAPLWFLGVGLIGAVPFLLTSDALSRFDRRATSVLTGVALGVGAAAAVVWKAIAWSVFQAFPILWPSVGAQHGLATAAVLALGAFMVLAQRERYRQARLRVEAEQPRLRIEEVGQVVSTSAAEEDEAEAYDEARAAMRRAR